MRALLIAVAALALVVPSAPAATPALLSVGQQDRHPTATFAVPGADDATIYLASKPDQATDGRFFQENVVDLDFLTAEEIQSGYWLGGSQLDPGRYYVMLRASDWDCSDDDSNCLGGSSNVLVLAIPKPFAPRRSYCRIAGSEQGLADLQAQRMTCSAARAVYRESLRVSLRNLRAGRDANPTRFRFRARLWTCRSKSPRREINGQYVHYQWRCTASGKRIVRYRWLTGD